MTTEISAAIPVFAPLSSLIADLEKLEALGYALNKEPNILLRPNAISS